MAKRNSQSPIASLPEKMTTETARGTGGKVHKVKNFTGQYWYDCFVESGKEIDSRMDIIRRSLNAIDTATLKTNLNDMVDIAVKRDEADGFKGKNKSEGPYAKAAANSRSLIQRIFGALKHAEKQMQQLGYKETTGFIASSVLAKKALDMIAIRWDGTKAKSKEEREMQAAERLEDKAFRELKSELRRSDFQNITAYNSAILAKVPERVEQYKREKVTEVIDKEVERLLAMGEDQARAAAEAVLETLKAREKANKAEAKAEKRHHAAPAQEQQRALV